MYVVEQVNNSGFIIKSGDRVVITIVNVPPDDEGSAFYLANTICDVLNDEVPRVLGAQR